MKKNKATKRWAMSFCKFSSQYSLDSSILIDNVFINEYLPDAPEVCLKVYLYGLMLCNKASSDDNMLDRMATSLNISEEDIKNAFVYWESYGLVKILPGEPYEVAYMPLSKHSGNLRKFKTSKYADFNDKVQELLSDRVIYPSEFNEYYSMIENLHFEPEALLLIIKHCTAIKNKSISSAYIFAVAQDFARQNLKTMRAVDDHLLEQEKHSQEIQSVLKELGLKRTEADQEERNMYLKWISKLGFTHGTVLAVAKTLKNKGGMFKLDEKLTKCFEQKLFTLEDIEEFSKKRDQFFSLAKEVTTTLGVYYQNLENVVDTYISTWTQKGLGEDVIKEIATYCFKKSIRTLEGMNTIIEKFYKLGLLTLPAITQYIGGLVAQDEKIKAILDKCNVLRNVNSWDRDFYRTWTYSWGLSDDIILFACESAKNKAQPIQYLNKIIASLHEKNITTLENAKNAICTHNTANEAKKPLISREYNKQELDSLFDNLDDIEV